MIYPQQRSTPRQTNAGTNAERQRKNPETTKRNMT